MWQSVSVNIDKQKFLMIIITKIGTTDPEQLKTVDVWWHIEFYLLSTNPFIIFTGVISLNFYNFAIILAR